MRDDLGLELSGADAAGLAQYRQALRGLQTFTGDPVAASNAAIGEAPGFVMAHVLKGYLYALSTEARALPEVRACHEAAGALKRSARETAHVAALGALANGGWREASGILERLTGEHPQDALALQIGHQIDFFTGNARLLRDRVARALPTWDEAMPGYHAMLSAHAFGLEENGDYGAAEAEGRRAADLEPSDGWAQHAVAHVLEMQSRQADGIAWMRGNEKHWSGDSFLKVHNWWHLALYHYELGDHDAVLALYDERIFADSGDIALNLVDSSALLWRLHLAGVDVGDRWAQLADRWAPYAASGNYAFNDAHAMMAFSASNRTSEIKALMEAQREAASGANDNAGFTRDVGIPAVGAIKAFADGDYRRTIALISPLRSIAHRFGGSHAQRDFLDLTLIEAALRAGDRDLAKTLSSTRREARPASPLSGLFVGRAKALA